MAYTRLQDYFHKMHSETNRLIVYRNILKDEIVNKTRELLFAAARENIKPAELQSRICEICFLLMETVDKYALRSASWQEYLLYLITTDENVFSRAAEKFGPGLPGKNLCDAAAYDLEILKNFFHLNLRDIGKIAGLSELPFPGDFESLNAFDNNFSGRHYRDRFQALKRDFVNNIPSGELVNSLAGFYHAVGCGKMGIHIAFRWVEGEGLMGVKYPDPVTLEDLIGYEKQKEIVIKNTEAFVRGKPANNLLLYGERGTGKSSTIKALANRYSPRGLRLVEVAKHQLPHFPEILQKLRDRAQRFIIFIDDLSFESYETEYKYLKAILEGGIEVNPDNVLIYATSNRRHLVQENWSDRVEQGGEIHVLDSVQEKLSLADRFGITVTYTSPDQEEYLQIVEGLARNHGIDIPANKLREMALQWERWHNARSGRTARQFINHLLGSEDLIIRQDKQDLQN